MNAGAALTAYATALDDRDWDALAALLAPGFSARFAHTGETFDAASYVALNRDYPGRWRFRVRTQLDNGPMGSLLARVTDATGASAEVHHVAVFATVDDDGRLIATEELWTEQVAPPRDERRPASAVGGPA